MIIRWGLFARRNLFTRLNGLLTGIVRQVIGLNRKLQGKQMNDAQLEAFRLIAQTMNSEPTDWQWNGQYMSQQHHGITRTRAESLVARHGGVARQMTTTATSQ